MRAHDATTPVVGSLAVLLMTMSWSRELMRAAADSVAVVDDHVA